MTPFAIQQAWFETKPETKSPKTAPSKSPVSAPFSRYSEADVPTEYGTFRIVCYRETTADGQLKEHIAVVNGDVRGMAVPVRVHSECLTGEVLHSLKCDCREQLDHAQVRACPCCVCPQFASCCFSLKASARPSAAGCLETKERG